MILGTGCVPWSEDDSLAEAGFRRSCRVLAARGLRARYVFGTAGVRRDAPAPAAMRWEVAGLLRELIAAVDPGPHLDGAFDELFGRLLVPDFALRLLPPYQGASEVAFQRVATALREGYPSWQPPI